MVKTGKDSNFEILRARAEARLEKLASEDKAIDPEIAKDLKSVLHELRVYHEELLMQNEELLRTGRLLEASGKEYADLYNKAPVGYATLTRNGNIINLNYTLQEMIICQPGQHNHSNLYYCLKQEDRDLLYLHLNRVFNDKVEDQQRVHLISKEGEFRSVLLSSRRLIGEEDDVDLCLTAVIDMSTEDELREALLRSKNEIHDLLRHLEKATEEERLRISHFLHDNLGQLLTAILIDVKYALKSIAGEGNQNVIFRLNSALNSTKNALTHVQEMTGELRPSLLNNLGLYATILDALENFSKQTGIQPIVKIPDIPLDIEKDYEIILFRVIKECLTNIVRHAGASQVTFCINKYRDYAELLIEDNGSGISKSEIEGRDSYGILIMKERIMDINGSFEIEGKKDQGTTIKITIPQNKTDK